LNNQAAGRGFSLRGIDMKKTLLAALVFATATSAFAQTSGGSSTVIGNSPQTLTFSDNAGFFGDVLGADNKGATFADRFTFTIDGTTNMSLDAIISSISHTSDTGLDITGLALYGSNDTLVSNGTMMKNGTMDVWTLSTNNLAAGNYYLQVSGSMVSDTAGSFGGAAMLAPVPEPETYGMMLGGLGVLGFLARRRKAKQA
jgi:PEP-CTERM motif